MGWGGMQGEGEGERGRGRGRGGERWREKREWERNQELGIAGAQPVTLVMPLGKVIEHRDRS